MIACSLNSPMLDSYKKVHPRLDAALEALKKLAAADPADGRHDIDGDNIYAMVSTGETRTLANAQFEMHKQYIDIQYILRGKEIIANETIEKLTPTTEYQPDYQLFAMNDEYDPMVVNAGELLIIFPDEPHAPSIAIGDASATVKKIIVKVLA